MNDSFELFYWENGWRSLGVKEGNRSSLPFHDVPNNTLLLLKNLRWPQDGAERIFTYEDGKQKWY
ncbi:hypothetical protein K4L44_06855 [Halosquirtibacter laminarini]|uniref:Uncharacterized protein n=1 Tax=Halosquirtibacter laminarini TaxID=3374600 RepID=A0AC61NIJ7_9BACT|nr:hypothetical protein K4L44_06855 [Prolixibacteraceae bacterium]